MYYVRTADRLQRTAAWLEDLEGGLDAHPRGRPGGLPRHLRRPRRRDGRATSTATRTSGRRRWPTRRSCAGSRSFVNAPDDAGPVARPTSASAASPVRRPPRSATRGAGPHRRHHPGGTPMTDRAARPRRRRGGLAGRCAAWTTCHPSAAPRRSSAASRSRSSARRRHGARRAAAGPFSDANVMSRGIVGSPGRPADTVASPMYKQVFDLATGACLDAPGQGPGRAADPPRRGARRRVLVGRDGRGPGQP